MKNFNWKSLLPHVIAIGIFVIVAVIYCKPALEGKVLSQNDVTHWKGMAQDLIQFKEKNGQFPLWNNNLFGGMPAYQIAMESSNPVSVGFLHNIFMLGLPKPIGYFFLLCISFYFLSQVVGANSWLGVLGGIAYAFATYSPVIIIAGHETKMLAMGYLPAVLGSIWLIYKKKYVWGLALTALFSGLLVGMNHLQVTYYFLIMAAIMTIAFVIEWIKEKDFKHIFIALSLALVGGIVGAGSNLVNLATTSDFAKATMRGGTSLDTASVKTNKPQKTNGLSTQYAFYYGSYGPAETFSFIVPGIYGGSTNGGELSADSRVAKVAIEKGIPDDQAAMFASSMSTYWGPQPMTSGPVYLGAVICFLFIFGMIYLKTWHRWWILTVCILSVLLSWGSNFAAFNDFVFNNLPLYNKFRAPSIILILPQLLFPLVAVMALNQFLFVETDKKAAAEKLKLAAYITAGIFALLAIFYISFNYTGANDAGIKGGLSQALRGNQDDVNLFFNALIEDRKSLFGKDLIRSLILVFASLALLWLFVQNKIKNNYVLAALIIISSFDLLSIDKRYLNDASFQDQETYNETNYKISPIDAEILKDSSKPRVFNLTVSSFNDATTAYHHRDIGGYSPVKLSIVEDLLNFQLKKQPLNKQVLDMLNTKYVITQNPQNGQPALQINPEALGNVWFVKHISYANEPIGVMKAMDRFNPKDTAIIEAASKKEIAFEPVADSTASIRLLKNENDLLEYSSNAKTNQFAVFSEIFYNRGWKAYIDDKESAIIQTNYVLRGLAIPAGAHKIRFEFKPASYYESKKAATVSSGLIWLLLIVAVASSFRKQSASEQKA
ncbi:MAG: YfhO family protein [Chitinophagaceae bacterium]|nr:YfhO family protein [Chitinophagaceae bacterium]